MTDFIDICAHCGRVTECYKVGEWKLCEDHKDLKQYQPKAPPKKLPNKKSKKRESEEQIYTRKKRDHMADHPYCQAMNCNQSAMDLHHRAGRQGYADEWAREQGISLFIDERYFMSVCRSCHKWIEANPKEAEKRNYIVRIV